LHGFFFAEQIKQPGRIKIKTISSHNLFIGKKKISPIKQSEFIKKRWKKSD
jgi:hypothetical protein